MTRAQKVAKAQELRAQGLNNREIGERLGVSTSAAWKWLNPEAAKEAAAKDNARRELAKQAWAKANRKPCPECGALMGIGSAFASSVPLRCAECAAREVVRRTKQVLGLRAEGLLNYEIAERLGVTVPVVASLICRADRYGLEKAISPWWERAA